MWNWPNSRISVMGGEQAANVLSTVRRDVSKEKVLSGQIKKKAFLKKIA